MNLEQLIQLLNQDEQTEFETPVSESQAGGDSKAIRGRLARLAIGVLKRLGQNPNPGPIIGPFNQLYAAASARVPDKLDLPGLSAIGQYPYPLAMDWQAVEAESVPFVRLHRSFDAFETLIRFLSTITHCSLAPNTISLDLRRQLVNLMERPSLDIWVNLLHIAVSWPGDDKYDPISQSKPYNLPQNNQ
ncbi:MAG: hypothetical protein QGG39_18320 [Candidatus Poribacteria bacterium]|nr:hypothetical protein [Candidatus Poribacteria bacterium]